MIAPQPHIPALLLIAPPALPAVSDIAPFDTLKRGAEKAPVPANTLEAADWRYLVHVLRVNPPSDVADPVKVIWLRR
jgi:hypothetical protein